MKPLAHLLFAATAVLFFGAMMPRAHGQSADPLPLIPEAPDTGSKPKGKAVSESNKKPSTTDHSSEELKQRIRFREVKTLALKDPQIQAEWDNAHLAKTDYEKRQGLKTFYKLLYAKMVRIDPSLKKQTDLAHLQWEHRLTETRIDPTEPINPLDRSERSPERNAPPQ